MARRRTRLKRSPFGHRHPVHWRSLRNTRFQVKKDPRRIPTAEDLQEGMSRSHSTIPHSAGWWRRRESNPRPNESHRRFYARVLSLNLTLRTVDRQTIHRASSHEYSYFAARLPGVEASLLYSPCSLNRHQRQDVANLSRESQLIVGFYVFPGPFNEANRGPRRAPTASTRPSKPGAPKGNNPLIRRNCRRR